VEAVRGRERSSLVKTVLFPSRIEAVTEAMPDVRYIYLIRDPRKRVPSALIMFMAPWKVHSPLMVGTTPETARFAQVFVDGYRKYASVRARMPSAQWLTVDLADLVGAPGGAVRRIYDHLGYELGPRLAGRLGTAAREARDSPSGHAGAVRSHGPRDRGSASFRDR
jgi:hypothetical protein